MAIAAIRRLDIRELANMARRLVATRPISARSRCPAQWPRHGGDLPRQSRATSHAGQRKPTVHGRGS